MPWVFCLLLVVILYSATVIAIYRRHMNALWLLAVPLLFRAISSVFFTPDDSAALGHPPLELLFICCLSLLPLGPLALAPLALAWNRHR